MGVATRKSEGLHVELRSKDGPETVVVDRIVTIERGADLTGLGLKEINLDEEMDYLKVNGKMETGVAGVCAIGDLTHRTAIKALRSPGLGRRGCCG